MTSYSFLLETRFWTSVSCRTLPVWPSAALHPLGCPGPMWTGRIGRGRCINADFSGRQTPLSWVFCMCNTLPPASLWKDGVLSPLPVSLALNLSSALSVPLNHTHITALDPWSFIPRSPLSYKVLLVRKETHTPSVPSHKGRSTWLFSEESLTTL